MARASKRRATADADVMPDTDTEDQDLDLPTSKVIAKGTARGGTGGKLRGEKQRRAEVNGQINGSVWHAGKIYGPGKEAELIAANLPEDDMQRLTDEGIIEGFDGYEAKEAE